MCEVSNEVQHSHNNKLYTNYDATLCLLPAPLITKINELVNMHKHLQYYHIQVVYPYDWHI